MLKYHSILAEQEETQEVFVMNYEYVDKPLSELRRCVGIMGQLAGIRQYVLADGRGRGCRSVEVDNGSGLRFTVLPDRGMDLGAASYKGMPLSFLASPGICHPAFHESDGTGWLRSWGGGLLTGCGLDNVGSPGQFEGESLGLHGRLSHLSAENCDCTEIIDNDCLQLSFSGMVRQARMFGENLVLRRQVATAMGDNRIILTDIIQNQGFRPARVMVLYHINLGFPLVDGNAFLTAPQHQVTPRDDIASAGLDQWSQCQGPTREWQEQCFYHDLPVGDDGMARIALVNPDAGLSFEVAFRKAELPVLTQWKQMGEGEYVMGLEPGNCHVEGAASEHSRGTLRVLQPDEEYRTRVELTVKEV